MILALIVFVSVTGLSYLVIDYTYGGGYVGSEDSDPQIQTNEDPGSSPEFGIDVLRTNPGKAYLSMTIGAGMGIVSLIGWVASRQIEKDATTILLEKGLEDMTVRDVDIVRHMMKMEEFTVPELVRKTDVSRTSVWRLVKRMSEYDLVEETDEEKLPKSGRGKPSKVYRYVGP